MRNKEPSPVRGQRKERVRLMCLEKIYGEECCGEETHAVPCPKRQMGTAHCHDGHLRDSKGGVSGQVCVWVINSSSAEIPVK